MLKIRLCRFWLAVMVLTTLAGCAKPSGPDFAIYLLAPEVTTAEAAEMPLDDLPLMDEPLFSMQDMVRYRADTYEMTLMTEAAERLAEVTVPLNGLPFVVVAQGERIYTGAFWTPISSMSYHGVTVTLPLYEKAAVLGFSLGYPAAPELFTGKDLRNDDRILAAFAAAGKLAEEK
jgi:hypothetical protein